MQSSGEIFDPEYVMLDQDRRIAYRKEMFDSEGTLPRELIVRDRRYSLDEIAVSCERRGLEVVAAGFVKVGNFDLVDRPRREPTKEILVVARKRLV